MATSLIFNALQGNFDSVLSLPDEGMIAMFKALESTGLLISCVQSKYVGISEELFAGAFELPTEGLTLMDAVPKDLVYDARSLFSASGEPVKTSCKKKELKIEFRLMNDIFAKSVTVKAGSFDAVTHEQFFLMTTIHFGLKINWSQILFDILKEMVNKSSKQAKGFAAQICVLLKGAPDLTLGEAKTFPPLKILTKAAAKRRPAPAVSEPVAKRKGQPVGRFAPTEKSLALVPVATEASETGTRPAFQRFPLMTRGRSLLWRKSNYTGYRSVEKRMQVISFLQEEAAAAGPVVDEFVPLCFFIEPVQDLDSRPPYSGIVRRRWAELMIFLRLHLPMTFLWMKQQLLILLKLSFLPQILQSFAQFRAIVDKIQFEQVHTRDVVADLKDILSSKITGLELGFAETFNRQNLVYQGLFNDVRRDIQTQKADLTQNLDDIRKELHDQKAALVHDLLEFRVETRENFATLSAQLS
ncbi:hypothetical protein F511_21176 [Dorcoceras hygrometricum]|uniref:Uncharacterized protein n=1 Tax=Dorcoceras hygrometricum TaxID=472368 RepID=A0A2Z7B935_9LAMI|nr:hypothetical protein F511_21176 [Dorcoceras hygrometricum]